jgi:hypothetical protein
VGNRGGTTGKQLLLWITKGGERRSCAVAGRWGRLQEDDDMWAPPVIGGKGRRGTVSKRNPGGPWAALIARPNWFPWPFSQFRINFLFSFLFLFSELLYSFFILIQKYFKPACTNF